MTDIFIVVLYIFPLVISSVARLTWPGLRTTLTFISELESEVILTPARSLPAQPSLTSSLIAQSYYISPLANFTVS